MILSSNGTFNRSAERIAWGTWGVLSFIALIVWYRWRGTPEDQREVTPPELPKRKERQNETVEINPSAPPHI
jgi:hypothetical protein